MQQGGERVDEVHEKMEGLEKLDGSMQWEAGMAGRSRRRGENLQWQNGQEACSGEMEWWDVVGGQEKTVVGEWKGSIKWEDGMVGCS